MRILDLADSTADAVRSAGAYLSDWMTPTIRLGVTGFARSGKTVFITALVRNLMAGGRLPFFAAMAEGRIRRAYLEPQPDDDIARFGYEEHVRELIAEPPRWPDSTRQISQLRLSIEYASRNPLRRALGHGRVHLDIVDYPGEWLIDLPLLELTFRAWSQQALAEAKARARGQAQRAWLAFLAPLNAEMPADEQLALTGAQLFADYLGEARASDPARIAPGPGRFLWPGDLAGSPLLTFFPLPPSGEGGLKHGTLGAMLSRRFESYKARVVKPFFRDHFARLDRQIVLIDVLSALNGGPQALTDLAQALDAILKCFRPGANSWLSSMLGGRRIDRVLFAATKADHLHHRNHDRLEALLGSLVDQAMTRTRAAGADVKVLALAALRATREAEARAGAERLPCILGVPMPGQRLGERVFDGVSETALFPGDLPSALPENQSLPLAAIDPVSFLSFRPPRLKLAGPAGDWLAWPHIRLDRAVDFLIGDQLT
ncbi:MAG TPA: YcjX family protein [Hyphomicrobiaceae bacterium]|nr:YcjX family protein [Hyphomicrobiaceae bacterium]